MTPTRFDHAAIQLWSTRISLQHLKGDGDVSYCTIGNHNRLRWSHYSRPLIVWYTNNTDIEFIGSRNQTVYEELAASICFDRTVECRWIVGSSDRYEKACHRWEFQAVW